MRHVQRRRVRQFEKCRCAIDNQRRLDVEHFSQFLPFMLLEMSDNFPHITSLPLKSIQGLDKGTFKFGINLNLL